MLKLPATSGTAVCPVVIVETFAVTVPAPVASVTFA